MYHVEHSGALNVDVESVELDHRTEVTLVWLCKTFFDKIFEIHLKMSVMLSSSLQKSGPMRLRAEPL